jgi:predicted transcriptional regulator
MKKSTKLALKKISSEISKLEKEKKRIENKIDKLEAAERALDSIDEQVNHLRSLCDLRGTIWEHI